LKYGNIQWGSYKEYYPLSPVEPCSSDKTRFTLMQKSLPMKEFEFGNEEVREIVTTNKALCFKPESEYDAISTFLSSPNSIFDPTR
jgi:hypothetical protein